MGRPLPSARNLHSASPLHHAACDSTAARASSAPRHVFHAAMLLPRCCAGGHGHRGHHPHRKRHEVHGGAAAGAAVASRRCGAGGAGQLRAARLLLAAAGCSHTLRGRRPDADSLTMAPLPTCTGIQVLKTGILMCWRFSACRVKLRQARCRAAATPVTAVCCSAIAAAAWHQRWGHPLLLLAALLPPLSRLHPPWHQPPPMPPPAPPRVLLPLPPQQAGIACAYPAPKVPCRPVLRTGEARGKGVPSAGNHQGAARVAAAAG